MLDIEKLRVDLAAENRRDAIKWMTIGAGLLVVGTALVDGIAAAMQWVMRQSL